MCTVFAEHDGTEPASQIKAFNDTWHRDRAAAGAYEEFVVAAPHEASQAMQAFRTLLGLGDGRTLAAAVPRHELFGQAIDGVLIGGARRIHGSPLRDWI
jgi:hypothetical protein